MVRAEFELPITDGAWEDAIEIGGSFIADDPAIETSAVCRPPFDPVAEARRIEDWIAFNLDDAAHLSTDRPASSRGFLGGPDRIANIVRPKTGENSSGHWPRFRVTRRRGVTIVRLTDQSLIKSEHFEELAADLFVLIDGGDDRIVLNFAAVERLGSLAAGFFAEAHRRCRAAEGGELRICLVQPQLSGIFAIPRLTRSIASYADEATAVEDPWPKKLTPRPLPVEILSLLALDMNKAECSSPGPHQLAQAVPAVDPPAEGPPRFWLIDESGRGKMLPVGINGSRFIIGRDRACDLRLASPHVSKRHAAIERRGGLAFLRDLGSKNGTRLNGRLLRNRDAEICPGDHIGMGDMQFVVAGNPLGGGIASATVKDSAEESIAGWMRDDETEGVPPGLDAAATLQDLQISHEPAESLPFKYEVIEDVLVITPRLHQLSDEQAVAGLRSKLQELFESPLPRRVVVSLEFVSNLSPQAIGVLLAHLLRLERVGGGLRVCQAGHKLMTVLDRIHLTMLMECYPTLDDAILVVWP